MNLSALAIKKQLQEKATSLGFALFGVTQASSHNDSDRFRSWLDKGYQASMQWMERSVEKRTHPQLVLQGAKSFICVGLPYYRGYPKSIEKIDSSRGWISNYAWGDDYHLIMDHKLKELQCKLVELIPQATSKIYVDTGPVLERSYGHSAGLGWIGKNTCLINTKIGSYFFIGEIITDQLLPFDEEGMDHCGKCSQCLDQCPTQALSTEGLDANKCISYLTIEHRDEIEEPLKSQLGHHLYGCDICQDVCPWNQKIPVSGEASFEPRAGLFHPELNLFDGMTQEEFSKSFKNSPIKRTKLKGIMRNAQMVRNFNERHRENKC